MSEDAPSNPTETELTGKEYNLPLDHRTGNTRQLNKQQLIALQKQEKRVTRDTGPLGPYRRNAIQSLRARAGLPSALETAEITEIQKK